MGLISLLITLLIILVVVWLVYYIIGMMGLPEPIRRAVMVIAGLIILLWLLQRLGII